MAVVPLLFHSSEGKDNQTSSLSTDSVGAESAKSRVRIAPSNRRFVRSGRAVPHAPNATSAPTSASVSVARSSRAAPVVPNAVPSVDLSAFLEMWQINGEFRNLSAATRANRALVVGKLIAYLTDSELAFCSPVEVQKFIAFVRAGGTRDKAKKVRVEPARPNTVASYFSVLRAFFTYLVKDGLIAESPCAKLDPPRVPQDQVLPYTDEQVLQLLEAAKQTMNPRRDFAIVALLAETGLRASELVGIRMGDVDMGQHHILVMGKGGKTRTVGFGLQVKSALMRLLLDRNPGKEDYVFVGSTGQHAGQAFTRSALQRLLNRLGKKAGITGAVRTSPHTFRHYAAVTYIANDADAHMVKTLLGHTSLKMTDRYVALGQAAIDKKVKKHSPLDNLKRASKK